MPCYVVSHGSPVLVFVPCYVVSHGTPVLVLGPLDISKSRSELGGIPLNYCQIINDLSPLV